MLQIFAKKKGFTLIELLVVIAIIGILASIVLVSMGGARQSAKNSVRKSDMRQIVSAQELYYNSNSDAFLTSATYPTAIGTFMVKTPLDPGTKAAYGWVSNVGAGQQFCAYATLESPTQYYVASNAGNFCFTTAPSGTDANKLLQCEGAGTPVLTTCP